MARGKKPKIKNIPVKPDTFEEYLTCFDGKKTHDQMVRCLVVRWKKTEEGVENNRQLL